MTRVEKFRQYREEISNMKVEEFSTKRTASKKIDEITSSKASSRLAYDELMSAYDILNTEKHREKKLFGFRLRLGQAIYLSIATITVVTLLILIIVVAKSL